MGWDDVLDGERIGFYVDMVLCGYGCMWIGLYADMVVCG